ncbi:MAG: dihydrofolate reductase [Bordetella sp.]|nr:MAG: dihydrofolate reductase [Bordetella sp.]
MKLAIVVAYSSNRTIGLNGSLPWKLLNDLNHFKKITMGFPIIMGRNTWNSINRPLCGRINIVISRNKNHIFDKNVFFVNSIQEAISICNDQYEYVFIIGGEKIYQQTIHMVQTIFATEIHANIKGDVFFPKLSSYEWIETKRESQNRENGYNYDFVTYVKNIYR